VNARARILKAAHYRGSLALDLTAEPPCICFMPSREKYLDSTDMAGYHHFCNRVLKRREKQGDFSRQKRKRAAVTTFQNIILEIVFKK
jgi:hypothetical protein